MKSDKLIAVHNGALGDFLCAWPALLALARGVWAQGGGPERPPVGGATMDAAGEDGGLPRVDDAPRLLFAGNMERMRWLAPLGYAPCPPAMRRALEGLYGEQGTPAWPDDLTGATMAWFCLDRLPVAAHPRIVSLPCLPPGPNGGEEDKGEQGRTTREAEPARHVTDALRNQLERASPAALPWTPRWDADWHGTWQRLFGGWEGADSHTVVLVPGAGHRAKQWPPQRFAALAGELARAGYNPLYVLGPAELERGLALDALMPEERPEGHPEGRGVPVVTPADHGELAEVLRRARLVLGNDSGPLHLAALHGAPVLALFGPAPAATWRPHGAMALASPLDCAPCSATLRDLGCGRRNRGGKEGADVGQMPEAAPCMDAITVEAVLDAVLALLNARR
ncbi:glycosyltransferase family 9 protein [Nitratidesulfovibrio sp. 1201_IL3209]|uniref:glycosyltransferase family 9 protein n=1 Tax=Nitratidesulfovibrio sp. 1201_IL3209 TaxID=3084053 RepID=UPI002FDA9482